MNRRGAHHYYATACGHRHRTPEAAARCRNRGHSNERRGPYPVIEVTIRPGRTTRTRELPEPGSLEARRRAEDAWLAARILATDIQDVI